MKKFLFLTTVIIVVLITMPLFGGHVVRAEQSAVAVCDPYEMVVALQLPGGKVNLARLNTDSVAQPEIFTNKIAGDISEPAIRLNGCSLLQTIKSNNGLRDIYWGWPMSDGTYKVVNMTLSPDKDDFSPQWITNDIFVYLSKPSHDDWVELNKWEDGVTTTVLHVYRANALATYPGYSIMGISSPTEITMWTLDNKGLTMHLGRSWAPPTEIHWIPEAMGLMTVDDDFLKTVYPDFGYFYVYKPESLGLINQRIRSLTFANLDNVAGISEEDGLIYTLNPHSLLTDKVIVNPDWGYKYLAIDWVFYSSAIPEVQSNYDFWLTEPKS